MRKQGIFFMLCIFAGGASVSAAPLTPADFQYCADVVGQLTANSLYQVHLTGEVLEKSAGGGYEDLRLFGPGGKETPLVIIGEDRPAETVETYPLEITGYSADYTAAVITVKLPEKHRPISVIDLETPDRDFKKQVKLEGSHDKKIWQSLADDVIYDFSSQVDLRKTRIAFAKSDFRHYRFRLSDSKPAGGHPSIRLTYEGLDFSVNGVQKKELRIRKAEGRTGAPKERDVVFDEKVFANPQASTDKDGNTVIIVKTGLPLDRLAFDVSNPYYYRTVNLYASDTGKDDSYYLVARQAVYRFPLTSEQHETRNTIEPRSPKRQFYKMVIENKNNPQLDIKSITAGWVQKNLYFIALSAAGPYSLCFGNPGLALPDYDIAHFINSNTLPQHTYEKLTAAAIRENKDYEAPVPGGQKVRMEKTILRIVVVVLVIGIGYWLYALMKKISREKGT